MESLRDSGASAPVFSGVPFDERQSVFCVRLALMELQADAKRARIASRTGETVVRSRFLACIGRHAGRAEYQWLNDSFLRLSLGMLEVKTSKYTVGEVPHGITPRKGVHRVLHLIDSFDLDEDLDTYALRIDRRMVQLFGNREFALVDWEKRLQIKRQQDMAADPPAQMLQLCLGCVQEQGAKQRDDGQRVEDQQQVRERQAPACDICQRGNHPEKKRAGVEQSEIQSAAAEQCGAEAEYMQQQGRSGEHPRQLQGAHARAAVVQRPAR